ncbi:MAG: hypothetical protein E6I87_06870 [Chloroflexi bacterium]|nr:MAG: hypothetical protein E6I87_06870 [Chloroflexota bacterium]
MIRFEADRADPVAVRLAIVACRAPLRIERSGAGVAVIASDDDARAARRLWLRAGLEPRPQASWPDARALGHGVLEVTGTRRCIGRVAVDRIPPAGDLTLTLAPVPAPDALRAILRALDRPLRPPFRRRARRLARVAALLLDGEDGVAAAGAFALAPADDAARVFASVHAARLRRGALLAWRGIGEPRAGVWRSLAALQSWWS